MNAPNHSCRKKAHHHRKQPISLSKPFSAILINTHLESYRALTNTAKLARTPHNLVERGKLSQNAANFSQTQQTLSKRRKLLYNAANFLRTPQNSLERGIPPQLKSKMLPQ